jgi:hypothetical protein
MMPINFAAVIYMPVGPHGPAFFASSLNERLRQIRERSSLTEFGLLVDALHGRPFGLSPCECEVSVEDIKVQS